MPYSSKPNLHQTCTQNSSYHFSSWTFILNKNRIAWLTFSFCQSNCLDTTKPPCRTSSTTRSPLWDDWRVVASMIFRMGLRGGRGRRTCFPITSSWFRIKSCVRDGTSTIILITSFAITTSLGLIHRFGVVTVAWTFTSPTTLIVLRNCPLIKTPTRKDRRPVRAPPANFSISLMKFPCLNS